MIKALIQAEPSAPPVHDVEFLGAPEWFRDGPGTRTWGLTAIPITYAPPAKDASELAFERQEKADGPDLAKCWLQKSPARQLPNLQRLPIAIVTGEASFHGPYEHCVVKFLEQAGVHPTWLNLGAMGIHGNGHMMMLEKNSDQIADVIERWVRRPPGHRSAGRRGKVTPRTRRCNFATGRGNLPLPRKRRRGNVSRARSRSGVMRLEASGPARRGLNPRSDPDVDVLGVA
jgi:hypothetical protein